MATILDTHHNDFIHVIGDGRIHPGHNMEQATDGDDEVDLYNGGHDTVLSGAGNDGIYAQGTFDAGDSINGEAGVDLLSLFGNYKRGVSFQASTLTNVEHLALGGAFTYKLVFAEETIASTAVNPLGMTIYGGGATQQLQIDASADTDGYLEVHASDGNDVIVGSSGGTNDFIMSGTGRDSVTGGAQSDLISFTSFDRRDHVDGGGGIDYLSIGGDDPQGFFIDASMMIDVEHLDLLGAQDHSVGIADGVIAAGKSLSVGAGGNASTHLLFDASADTDGWLIVTCTPGDDLIRGSQFRNTITLSSGGNDTVYGGAGNDSFTFGNTFGALDRAYGGSGGDDIVIVSASSPTSLTLSRAMLTNIDTLQMNSGTFTLTTLHNLLDAGQTLIIVGQTFSTTNPLSFDGSAETRGRFDVRGTQGADTIIGGAGDDVLKGGGGKDLLTLGAGHDLVAFAFAGESSGATYDTVTGFNFDSADRFDVVPAITGIHRKIAHGTLSTGTFDTDLGAAANAHKLHIGEAVLFTPDAGDLAGHIFLIINGNNTAGYQLNADYVIELSGAHNLGAIDPADFI